MERLFKVRPGCLGIRSFCSASFERGGGSQCHHRPGRRRSRNPLVMAEGEASAFASSEDARSIASQRSAACHRSGAPARGADPLPSLQPSERRNGVGLANLRAQSSTESPFPMLGVYVGSCF